MTENRYEFQANEVVKLNLTTAVIPMTVREVEGTDQVVIYVKADEELTYQCKLEQGKVKLKFDDIHLDKKERWDEIKESDQKIEVELPKDLYLEKFKVSVAAGEAHVDLPSLKTEKAAFEVGAGKVFVDNLSALRKASFEIGAGSAEMTGLVFTQDTDVVLECGVGKVDMATTGYIKCKVVDKVIQIHIDLS